MKGYGKKAICDALCKLAKNRPIEEIFISDLITAAGVNRSTFYYHFSSVQAVLEYMIDDFSRNYLQFLKLPAGQTAKDLHPDRQIQMEQDICNYIATASPYVYFFFQEPNYRLFYKRFFQHCREYYLSQNFIQVFPGGHAVPLKKGIFYDYYLHMCCSQLFAILECWTERGFSETPDDFIHIINMFITTTITLQG